MANVNVNALTNFTTPAETDKFVAVNANTNEGKIIGYNALSQAMLNNETYSDLETTDKTVIGAINEANKSGGEKIGTLVDGHYTDGATVGADLSALDTQLFSQFTANNVPFYFDYQNGEYGWNSSPQRGADTFHPFKRMGGDATSDDVLYGKTVQIDGELVTGTMPNNGAVSKTIAPGGSYTIPKGYHDGSGKVTASNKTLHIVKVGTYTSNASSSAQTFNVATYVSKGCNVNNFAMRNVYHHENYSGANINSYWGNGNLAMTLSGNTLSIPAYKGADKDGDGTTRNDYITADVYVYYVE
jgi:hypothetical protein